MALLSTCGDQLILTWCYLAFLGCFTGITLCDLAPGTNASTPALDATITECGFSRCKDIASEQRLRKLYCNSSAYVYASNNHLVL